MENDPEGIEVFSETVTHELEHWNILEENWKDGICLSDDADKDGYNDIWELQYNFNPFVNESYSFGPGTKGYDYEELRCRTKQKIFTKKIRLFHL